MAKLRLIGPYQRMGPVAPTAAQTWERGEVVQVVAAGTVSAMTGAANTGLAVALNKNPDDEFEGTRAFVELARLGKSCEVEIRFNDSTALAQTHIGGGPYQVDASGRVLLSTTTNGVFRPLRVGRETALGDTSGWLEGVFTDASSFGES